MGAALYIVLEREIGGLDSLVNGKALAKASEALERLAHQVGVHPLMEFFSADAGELGEFLADHDVEAGEVPSEQWFFASDGLATVRALLSQTRKGGVGLASEPDVIADLEQFERVLSEAEKHKVRWHLAVDY